MKAKYILLETKQIEQDFLKVLNEVTLKVGKISASKKRF